MARRFTRSMQATSVFSFYFVEGARTIRMSRFALLLCWLGLIAIGQGCAADNTSMVDTLNKNYRGKLAMLRGFYCNSKLEYDSEGKVSGSPEPGAWTACGFVELKGFRVKGDKLEVRASRRGITFDNGKFVPVSGEGLNVRVRLVPGATVEAVDRALNVVFFDKQTKLIDAVPDYWKCYLQHPTLNYKDLNCDRPTDQQKALRVGNGVSAPKPISDRDPDYTSVASIAHYQGTVLLTVEVNETGAVENVNITRPLGLGLDDASVAAVRSWKFQPARRSGDPVRVQMMIEVNFHMGMKLKTLSDY